VSLGQVRHLVALQVHEDGARGAAFAQTEVVHAQHPHVLGFGTEGAADTVQVGVGAHEQAEFAGKPRPRLAAQSESDPL
jgi:hypothetical protein